MKLLRGLPCNPFASACFEQSSDFAVRTTGALVVVEVIFLVLLVVWMDVVAVAMGWVCARAGPQNSMALINTGERRTKGMVLLLGGKAERCAALLKMSRDEAARDELTDLCRRGQAVTFRSAVAQ